MTTTAKTDTEKMNDSHHLVSYLYEVGDDYELRLLQDLLERVGFQKDCGECGQVIYHDSACTSCEVEATP